MSYPLGSRPVLTVSVAASLALHLAGLAVAALMVRTISSQPHLSDARRGPALEVTVIAVPPPQFVLDGLVPSVDPTVAAFSKLPSTSRERRGEHPRERKKTPESVYYTAREVDVRAVPIGDIEPVNPDLTGRESGRVVLRVLINSKGMVDNVLVVHAEPQRNFGSALLTPFRQARFHPARKAGIPVASEMLVELRYGLVEEKR